MTLATGDPGPAYGVIRRIVRDTEGVALAVADADAHRAREIMERGQGISMEIASAVAFAGTARLVAEGIARRDETIVVCCSGNAPKHVARHP